MVLVTSLGFVRAYPTAVLAPSVEAPVPLTFEQPLPGWPVAALGTAKDAYVVVATDAGRGLRYAIRDVPGTGLQALNRDDEETIIGALTSHAEDELLLLTANGYARRLPLAAVFAPEKANSHGRVLISRRPLRALAHARPHLQAITTAGLRPVDAGAIPCEDDSTRSYRLLRLREAQEVLRLLTVPNGAAAGSGEH
jgi:DNA gyrase/topoisomerase IV subunit A